MTRIAVVLASVLILTVCGSNDPGEEPIRLDLVFHEVDTLINTESGLLAHPTDIAVGDNGDIYVADARNSQIVLLPAVGGQPVTIGRQGQGPGEFLRPSAVAPGTTGLAVFDRGNARVQHFSDSREFLNSIPTPPEALSAPVSLSSDGSLLVGSMGADSSLALSFDDTGDLVMRFGRPIVPRPAVFAFGSMKERIAQGQVPAEFRNDVLAARAPDGGVWLALQTEAEIRRYDALGELLWQASVDDPQTRRSRGRFFERNAETENPMAIVPLRLFSDLTVVGDELWVLLAGGQDDPAIVLTFDALGWQTKRLSAPAASGARSMSFDPVRARLLLGTPDDAQLVSVHIEG